MADVDWGKLKAEYISTEISCKALAEKYGISPNVVSKKATKDAWQNARRKCSEKAAEKIVARSARAKADAAMQGLDLIRYTMDLWNDNLRTLNETIKETPAYMLSIPSFASGIAKGLQTTYDLLQKMSGEGEKERKQRLALERKKLQVEKKKLELELKKLQTSGSGGVAWEITEDRPDE